MKILTESEKLTAFGNGRPWLPGYRIVEGDWIRWLRRASRKPKLFVGVSGDGFFFLGAWIVKPQMNRGIGCYLLLEQLGREAPDRSGPKLERPDSTAILSKLTCMKNSEDQIRKSANDRYRTWADQVERNNMRKRDLAKYFQKRGPKGAKMAELFESGMLPVQVGAN